MIIETIFSTLDETGRPNFAPMGVEWGKECVLVRPFRSSITFRNLASGGYGVANLSDDVLAFVRCALYDEILPSFPATTIQGEVFQDACSWIELAVDSMGGSEERAEFRCRILHRGRMKDFLGFCRASNAVIEAAILASRISINSKKDILCSLNNYMKIVDKTGSDKDKQAFRLVQDYVDRRGDQ